MDRALGVVQAQGSVELPLPFEGSLKKKRGLIWQTRKCRLTKLGLEYQGWMGRKTKRIDIDDMAAVMDDPDRDDAFGVDCISDNKVYWFRSVDGSADMVKMWKNGLVQLLMP